MSTKKTCSTFYSSLNSPPNFMLNHLKSLICKLNFFLNGMFKNPMKFLCIAMPASPDEFIGRLLLIILSFYMSFYLILFLLHCLKTTTWTVKKCILLFFFCSFSHQIFFHFLFKPLTLFYPFFAFFLIYQMYLYFVFLYYFIYNYFILKNPEWLQLNLSLITLELLFLLLSWYGCAVRIF